MRPGFQQFFRQGRCLAHTSQLGLELRPAYKILFQRFVSLLHVRVCPALAVLRVRWLPALPAVPTK